MLTVCVCGAASGRSQTAVDLSAPQRRRPKATPARSRSLTLMHTDVHITPHVFQPFSLSFSLSSFQYRYVFGGVSFHCFHGSVHLSLLLVVASWKDSDRRLSLTFHHTSSHSSLFLVFPPPRLLALSSLPFPTSDRCRAEEGEILSERERRGLMFC